MVGIFVGRRIAENFNLKGLHRLDIKDYLSTFFFSLIPRNIYVSLPLRAEIHKYYEECDWSKKWAEGLQKILT